MIKFRFWHIAIWLAVFIINLALMTRGEFIKGAPYEFLFVVIYALVFYINILVLFPAYYESKKPSYWISGVILMSAALLCVEVISEAIWGSHHHRRGDWMETILTFRQALWILLVFIIGTLLSIQDLLTRQIINREKLIEEKLQTELQLLKAQINPHFLFNALNNIYSLTYMKSDKAPESVLKLSEMLRYITDECSKDRVSLEDEILYIRNYIDFNRMKYPGDRKVGFQHPDAAPGVLIAPMLFIPFIENCFKYSRIEEDSSGFIEILIAEAEGRISFTARNSVFSGRRILEGSGKGIDNVKQRLGIIYPGKHMLTITPGEESFSVNLQIETK